MRDWTGNKASARAAIAISKDYNTDGREEHDFYATEPKAAEWLIQIEALNKNVWECACGEGHLAKVFAEHGFNVKATDLIERGFGMGGVDFLAETEQFDGDIVTNPPYKYAQEFIEKALTLIPDGNKVCMFLKIQFVEGIKRREMYDAAPPKTIWVSSSRLHCGRNGDFAQGSMVCYAWYVWEKGYVGDTSLKWFN